MILLRLKMHVNTRFLHKNKNKMDRQFPFKSYDLKFKIVIKYTTEMNYAFLLFLEIGECQEWFHTEKQHFLNKLIFFITL